MTNGTCMRSYWTRTFCNN